MDEELMAMLQPFYTPKLNYTATPPAAMLTQVFWDEPAFGPTATNATGSAAAQVLWFTATRSRESRQ